jgi:hypothetical protein
MIAAPATSRNVAAGPRSLGPTACAAGRHRRGAIATHVRVGESFALALIVAIVAWAGLYLRDARLRALLPLRRRGA